MHYTVANWLFDTVMPDKDANGSAFKVVSAVARMSAGWSRQWTENPMSFSDFEEMTGMARDSVANGLSVALEKGYIKRQKSGRSFIYSLTVKVPKRSDNPTDNSTKTELQTPEESENPTDNSPEIQPITGDTLYNINKDNSEPPNPPFSPATELPEPFKPKYLRFIPVTLQDNKLIDAWASWEEYRVTQGNFTEMSAKRQLKELGEWGLDRAIAAINHSIKQGYKGIYEPSKPAANGNGRHPNKEQEWIGGAL